jgi:hypothetical protein
MFMENCIVLAEGSLVDGVFRVERMGSPPPETREQSLEIIGSYDLFGTGITPQVCCSEVYIFKPSTMS